MTPNQRLLLAAASNLAEPGGPVSGRDIARVLGIRGETVRKGIAELRDAGLWPYRTLRGGERAAKGARLRAVARRPDADADAEVPARIAEVRAEKLRQAREARPPWDSTREVRVYRVCLPDHSRRPSDAI